MGISAHVVDMGRLARVSTSMFDLRKTVSHTVFSGKDNTVWDSGLFKTNSI